MGAGNKQHTFIETDTVRYVYQPIENLFLLLVTNKASNIVEDLETLRMLSKGGVASPSPSTPPPPPPSPPPPPLPASPRATRRRYEYHIIASLPSTEKA